MIAAIVKRVQAELAILGYVASEYRITEINGDGPVHYDHQTKTVRVGNVAAPNFLAPPTISFLDPVMPSFL